MKTRLIAAAAAFAVAGGALAAVPATADASARATADASAVKVRKFDFRRGWGVA
jgi:hypothetical protein